MCSKDKGSSFEGTGRTLRVALGADHAGFEIKEFVRSLLEERGFEVEDFGAYRLEPTDDYPDYACLASQAVSEGRVDFGVLVCGTGIGMAMVANKLKGVRAAPCREPEEAVLARSHNNANVLCLKGRPPRRQLIRSILEAWLDTNFEGGRHERRVSKILKIEEEGRGCG